MYFAAQDFDLWLKVALSCEIRNVNAPLVFYRLHEGSISTDFLRSARETENILQKHIEYAAATKNKTVQQAAVQGLRNVRSTFAYQAFDKCRMHFRKGEVAEVARHFWHTIALSKSIAIPAESILKHQILSLFVHPDRRSAQL